MFSFGLGVDHKYIEDYNSQIKQLVFENSENISHLSVVGLTDILSAENFVQSTKHKCFIHHLSNISPCGPDGPDLNRLEIQDDISQTLQAKWSCEDIGIWNLDGKYLPYFAPPLFTAEVAEYTARGIKELISNSSIPFAAENPSVTYVLGDLGLGEFFEELVILSGCSLVLDISHIYSYALATKRNAIEILKSYPLKHVIEIHIAGGRISKISNQRYVDSHSDQILPSVYDLLDFAIKNSPKLKAVTYEVGVNLSGETFVAECLKLEKSLQMAKFIPSVGNDG